jgi:hypothetical protein
MNEIAPGLWHWKGRHSHIGAEVSSYYLADERVLIDPMTPPGAADWFERHGAPEHVLLTCRHHDRDAWRLREQFGCTVHCIRNGVYELEGRGPVEPFDFGNELPGGVVAHEVNSISPDETALHLVRQRALACADGVIRPAGDGELAFVSDSLMDDPDETKRGLCAAYTRLLALDFDLLLLAHGNPVTSDAKQTLRRFVGGG